MITSLTDVPALVVTLGKYLSESIDRPQTELGAANTMRLLNFIFLTFFTKPTKINNIPNLTTDETSKLVPQIVFIDDNSGHIQALKDTIGEYL